VNGAWDVTTDDDEEARELIANLRRIDRVLGEIQGIASDPKVRDAQQMREFREAIAAIRKKSPLPELARRLARGN
jgi:hypothetical protein